MNEEELKSTRFDREKSGSLYSTGYADGYKGGPFKPHWYPQGSSMGENLDVFSDSEIDEYRQGYDAGKFNFCIDKK